MTKHPADLEVLFSAEAVLALGQVWADVESVFVGVEGGGQYVRTVLWLDGGI